jgi:alpha-tubulin suppressor-like RCC1 family protein
MAHYAYSYLVYWLSFRWGTNDYGQLGNGNTSYQVQPAVVLGNENIQVIAV